jgi:hypothetical protein
MKTWTRGAPETETKIFSLILLLDGRKFASEKRFLEKENVALRRSRLSK